MGGRGVGRSHLNDAVQQLVDRERANSQTARRERLRTRIESLRIHAGPLARGLVWIQMVLPVTLLIGFVLPEAAVSSLAQVEFVFELLLMYSMLCAPPLVTLLAPASRLPCAAKVRLIIATCVLGIGLPFALRSTFM